ncbi:12711_t:CDS:2 [Racocetra fulgida]|uniref:12711_t:CDS:1 n=1 Tax=Racocetra fulgida TaxID=60492 RepID=A0A9N9DVL6_9GLOM|nr:12711_t:CDS:2 [Racocetra fulgida]
MSSISRVESYNAKIKSLIFNSNTILLKLANVPSICINEEDKRTKYSLFRASVPKIALFSTAETILPNVCQLLSTYLTEETQKIQEDQIIQALHYHASCVAENELQVYNSVNLEDSDLFYNETFIAITAKALLNLIEANQIIHQASMNINYLNVLNQDHLDVMQDGNQEFIKEPRAATLLAVQNRDLKFIEILDNYLKEHQVERLYVEDKNKESSSKSNDDNLSPKDLVNPRKHKVKERPKETDRKQHSCEPPKGSRQQSRCSNCNGLGHN